MFKESGFNQERGEEKRVVGLRTELRDGQLFWAAEYSDKSVDQPQSSGISGENVRAGKAFIRAKLQELDLPDEREE